MLSAPNVLNMYVADDLPGLMHSINVALSNPIEENWANVKLELSIVIYVINSAASVLNLHFERS
jgi:hypothetical protein